MEWPTSFEQLSTAQLTVLVPAVILAADIVRRFIRNRIERKGLPLPPGPTGIPLAGSALSIKGGESWLTYTEWQAKFGDIVYARIWDTDVVILNTFNVARELMDKRSQIYSDRPYMASIKPYGHECNFGFVQYGTQWRLCRRIVHQTFRAKAALNFRPMQLRRARQVVASILEAPKDYPFHYSTFAASVAMSAIYDYQPLPRQDPLVGIVDDFIRVSFSAMTAEKARLIQYFPFLLYIPQWIPGMSWISREATQSYALSLKMVEIPFRMVQKRMNAKEYVEPDTMVFDHIHRMEKIEGTERAEYGHALKMAAATSFLGATGTTSTMLLNVTLAMVTNPRVWKRAQAEIDAVTRKERLPVFDDRTSLPYIDAIVRETFRWAPITPIGVPHATSSSDVFNGYFIPRGATVISNIWAMSRDESLYPDPEAFIPERFLDADGMLTDDDPFRFTFGFGGRSCPGRWTGTASVWIATATMLATLDFNLAKDENGKEIEVVPKFAGGLARHPVSFPCNLSLRSHLDREALLSALAK